MNRKKGPREKGLSGHIVTLHQRLYHALDLGFSRNSDNKKRKWLSSDVEIQRLAVRSISSFIDGIFPETIQLPLVKDSIPDIIEALEGILQLKNEALLAMTSAIAVKLVSILPSSILQPHVHFVHPLASLLSFHQSQVAINCASTLKLIISNLRSKHEKTVWEILRGIDAVSQIISNLQNSPDGAKAAEYVMEMTALLSAILLRWPSSRYSVWSDDKLMKTIKAFCVKPGSSFKVCVLQMFSALALCGYGAKKLLDDEDLLEVIVDCMGKYYPHSIRIQAIRVFRAIVVSEQGCSKILRLYSEPVTILAYVESTGRKRQTFQADPSNIYWIMAAAKATLMMIVINMIGLACYSGMPHFYKSVIEDGGVEILLGFIRRWLDDSLQREKFGLTSNLQGINDEKSCCRIKNEEWEGTEAPLLLALWSLSELLKLSCSEGRIGAALGEKEIADVKMLLKTGECLSVHGVILFVRCPTLLPPQETSIEDIDGTLRVHKEVILSAQVDHQALEKLLDFIYAGYVQVEEELVRKLKIFARHCDLQLLLHLLSRRRPKWGDPFPIFDLTRALGRSGLDFSDIILEAKSTKFDDWKCSLCSLSGPHMHAHKIVLLSSCEYMRALFLSGMQESHSQTLQVPVSLEALLKLANWFYSGELPKPVTCGCLWDNTDLEAKLAELQPYIELCWLAEYWMLDEVQTDCSEIVTSSLNNATELAVKILQFSAEFCQWNLVEFAANVAGPFYPSLRESGALDCLDDELIDMIRAASLLCECESLSKLVALSSTDFKTMEAPSPAELPMGRRGGCSEEQTTAARQALNASKSI
ncbi:hypothetical protein V2J09_013622 [Rumex salicifolius]